MERGTGRQRDGEATSQVGTPARAPGTACRQAGPVASREAGAAASPPPRDPGGGSARSRVRLTSK